MLTDKMKVLDELAASPCRIGLLITYNPWHYDQENDAWYHDDDLFFLGRRLQVSIR